MLLSVENKMVEQTRRRSQAVSLQAGPGEVDTGILFDVNLRYASDIISGVDWSKYEYYIKKIRLNLDSKSYIWVGNLHSL